LAGWDRPDRCARPPPSGRRAGRSRRRGPDRPDGGASLQAGRFGGRPWGGRGRYSPPGSASRRTPSRAQRPAPAPR
jgi:hypothetical protein